jgi:hypothetical protein
MDRRVRTGLHCEYLLAMDRRVPIGYEGALIPTCMTAKYPTGLVRVAACYGGAGVREALENLLLLRLFLTCLLYAAFAFRL